MRTKCRDFSYYYCLLRALGSRRQYILFTYHVTLLLKATLLRQFV